jgi:mevalonate pyrophosphate decarboxylase
MLTSAAHVPSSSKIMEVRKKNNEWYEAWKQQNEEEAGRIQAKEAAKGDDHTEKEAEADREELLEEVLSLKKRLAVLEEEERNKLGSKKKRT